MCETLCHLMNHLGKNGQDCGLHDGCSNRKVGAAGDSGHHDTCRLSDMVTGEGSARFEHTKSLDSAGLRSGSPQAGSRSRVPLDLEHEASRGV